MTVDDLEGARDATAPIDMLEQYYAAHGWAHERHGEEEIAATAPGSWTQYELRAVWREDDGVLQFLALPDIRVAADKRVAVYEAIGLINEQLWIGHFELWASTGLVVFRYASLLGGDGDGEVGLTLDQAETIVDAAVDECERFYPVFQFVLWGGKTPKEALAAALIETQGEA